MNKILVFFLKWIAVGLVFAVNWVICLIGRELTGADFLTIWELTIVTTLAHIIGLQLKDMK